ncbi:MAG: hypothetical protein QOF01_304, partial [Thermomicrobiales bacterium]|nr:hypothetical protein [Thermomicrobiales bacterium]
PVSIPTLPRGRVQHSSKAIIRCPPASFNPHPAARQGATGSPWIVIAPMMRFQSPPCREAGCNGANSRQISLSRRLSGAFSSRRAVGNSTITRVPGLSEPSRCANLTRGRRERRVRAMSARLGSPITRPTPTARRCSPIIAKTSTGARGGAASRRSLPPFSPTCSINRLGFYRSRRAGTTRARTALGKPAGSVWRVTPCEGNEFESLSGSC